MRKLFLVAFFFFFFKLYSLNRFPSCPLFCWHSFRNKTEMRQFRKRIPWICLHFLNWKNVQRVFLSSATTGWKRPGPGVEESQQDMSTRHNVNLEKSTGTLKLFSNFSYLTIIFSEVWRSVITYYSHKTLYLNCLGNCIIMLIVSPVFSGSDQRSHCCVEWSLKLGKTCCRVSPPPQQKTSEGEFISWMRQ